MKSKKLELLIEEIVAFNKARGWTPKAVDLAKSVVIESAELLGKFQWDESDKNIKGTMPKNWDEIGQGVADIFWYLVSFCNATGINLPEAIEEKIKYNGEKYPEEMFKGKHNDKFYKSQKNKYREARKK